MAQDYRLVVRVPFLALTYTGRQIIAASSTFATYCDLVQRAGAMPNVALHPTQWCVDFHGPKGAWYVIAHKTGALLWMRNDDNQHFGALAVSLYGCIKGCMNRRLCDHPRELLDATRKMAIDFAKCLSRTATA